MQAVPLPAHANESYATENHAAATKDTVTRCETLQSEDFSRTPDALTQVSSSIAVSSHAQLPGYCEVSGSVGATGFSLRLPLEQWNGKFMELGCAGYCGSTAHIVECDESLRKGYACIVNDGGHRSSKSNAGWAYQNPLAMIEYLVNSSHVGALAGKAITARFYARAPQRAYFMGCSGGGEQAMMEAQRLPSDFDGIVAGQPTSESAADVSLVWNIRSVSPPNSAPPLTQESLEWLHKAVLDKCDLNDGVKDGLIGDPRQCAIDPDTLLCRSGQTTQCLTPPQAAAIKSIYAGAHDSAGHAVSLPAALPGSELAWLYYQSPAVAHFAAEPFRYYELQPTPGPDWTLKDFDFDRDPQRLGLIEGLISPINPDLRAFKAHGGKLIAYAGWNDIVGMPLSAVDYYETGEKVMDVAEKSVGGRPSIQNFFRLFMVPGMNHCSGGEGAYAIDYLSALERWVEANEPPERLVGAHVNLDDLSQRISVGDQSAVDEAARRTNFPLDPAYVAFTRPIYPYPLTTHYKGRGAVKDAENFGP